MAINNPYIPGDPYSYDLKWIVDQLKLAIDLYQPLHDEFEDLKTYVNDYFDNLDLSAEVAQVINQMRISGYFDDLIEIIVRDSGTIESTTTQWLADNVTPVGSAVVVDASLTVAGAAADAKAAGDGIRAIDAWRTMSAQMFNKATEEIGQLGGSGAVNPTATTYSTSAFIPVTPGASYTIRCGQVIVLCEYNSSQVFITRTVAAITSPHTFTVGSTTSYIRFSYNNVQVPQNDYVLLTKTAEYQDINMEYGTYTMQDLRLTDKQNYPEYKVYQQGDIHFTVEVNQFVYHQASGNLVETDNEVFDYVPGVLRLPTSYSYKGAPTPLVVIMHGAGYGVSNTRWDTGSSVPAFEALKDKFVANGYAICDVNSYDSTFASQGWGSPRAVNAYFKMIEYVQRNYNVEKEINIYGFSMGGITALNFANVHRQMVKSIALGAPVVGIWSVCWNSTYGGSAGWRQASAIAYDFQNIGGITWTTGATPSAAELQAWNDNEYLMYGYDPSFPVNDHAKIKLPPTKIWIGQNDTAIPVTSIIQFRDDQADYDNPIIVRPVANEGHSICWGANSYINSEIIYWFNRFN